MPDVQTLTLRVKELGDSVDLWNVSMLWALGFAAVAAAWVGISTRVVITKSGKLAIAQRALSDEKERLLQIDLKTKDVEIGTLKLRSDTAKAGIASAETVASKAAQNAATAITEQQQVQIELAKQQQRAATAEKDLAQLKLARKPRRLTPELQVALVGMLSGYPKGSVSITCLIGDNKLRFCYRHKWRTARRWVEHWSHRPRRYDIKRRRRP